MRVIYHRLIAATLTLDRTTNRFSQVDPCRDIYERCRSYLNLCEVSLSRVNGNELTFIQ